MDRFGNTTESGEPMPSPLLPTKIAGGPANGGFGSRPLIFIGNIVEPSVGVFLNGILRTEAWKLATVLGLITRVQLAEIAAFHWFLASPPYSPGTLPA